MHIWGIVLEDGSDGFDDADRGRYLANYEDLLEKVALQLGVLPLRFFDGFKEAEAIAESECPDKSTNEWLAAYNDARDSIEPEWFEPSHAIAQFLPVKKHIEMSYQKSQDAEIKILIESLDALLDILVDAQSSGCTKFFLAVM